MNSLLQNSRNAVTVVLHYFNAKFEIKCLMEESRKMTYGRLAEKNCARSDSVTIQSNNVPTDSFGI